MLSYVKFRIEHLFQMNLQDAQEWVHASYDPDDLRVLEGDFATTLLDDGSPILCCGAFIMSANRGQAWALLSRRITPRKFVGIHTLAKQFLDGLPFPRLEAVVDCEFPQAHRWVKALGFELEAPRMRAYEIDGRDCALYAKVK